MSHDAFPTLTGTSHAARSGRAWRSARRCAAAFGLIAVGTAPALAQFPVEQPPGAWTVAGRQGMIQVVIVPLAQARDRAAYARQVELLCHPQLSCFINFYTNSTQAPPAVPLPDAIANEPTVVFRRSSKQAAELFRWSCRLKVATETDCF